MVVRVDLCCCRENAGILLTVSFRVFQSFCSNVAGSSEFCRYAADRLLTALSEILQSFYRHHNNSYLQSYCRAIAELLQSYCRAIAEVLLTTFCRDFAELLQSLCRCAVIQSTVFMNTWSILFKKIIIKLSQKKARPPLGEALPSISAAAWGLG